MISESQAREDIVEVCKRIYSKGWISSTDGNVSIKLRDNRFLITPSGVHKGFMDGRDLIVVDADGGVIKGSRKPSSEITLHMTCYEERPEINAVLHAHPTMCVAFSLARITLAKCLLPEVVFTLGSIPTADYAPPSTGEVSNSIRKYISEFDAIILERHGSLTVGNDVFAAYNTLERMEHVAEITYHARQLGVPEALSESQIERLQTIGESQGWPKRKIDQEACNSCNTCNKHSSLDCSGNGSPHIESAVRGAMESTGLKLPVNIEELIAEEVAAALDKA